MSPLLAGFAFGGGAAGTLPLATVSGTTGSPTIDTSSRPGKTIYRFTGSGSITFATAGTCEVLVVGGGGAGYDSGGGINYGNGGGGAGGFVYNASAYVTSGAFTVTVGAGGTAGGIPTNGNGSAVASNASNPAILALGGGGNPTLYGNNNLLGGFGASSAGKTGISSNSPAIAISTLPFTQGNTGGFCTVAGGTAGGGGGGGSGGTGANTSTANGGNGGAGTSNSITGVSVAYAGGGGGGGGNTNAGGTGQAGGGNGGTGNTSNGTAGTANSGSGGGGGGAGWSGGNGGSGVVIVVIG